MKLREYVGRVGWWSQVNTHHGKMKDVKDEEVEDEESSRR